MIFPLGLTVFETGHKKSEKRKKIKGGEAGEIDNFLGPWAKYLDEKDGSKPTEVNYINAVILSLSRRFILGQIKSWK